MKSNRWSLLCIMVIFSNKTRQRKKRVKNMIQMGGQWQTFLPYKFRTGCLFQPSYKKKLTDYFLANELLCSWGKLVFLGESYCWMYSVQVTRTFIPIFSNSSLPLVVIISPSVLTTIKVGRLLISYLYL